MISLSKKQWQHLLYGSIAGVALLTLAACGNSAKTSSADKALTVTIPGNLSTVNPATRADDFSQNVLWQVSEGLYTLNQKDEVAPGIATKIAKPTHNGTVYTIHLRKNAKWSDGSDITAQDFVNTFRDQVDPKFKSEVSSNLSYFKNYDAVVNGKKSASALGVKAIDKKTLQITLAKPQPFFNDLLAADSSPTNTKLLKKYGTKYGTSASKSLYSGPYKLVGWHGTNDTWTYVKNSHYYNKKKVSIKKINVKVVKADSTARNQFASNEVQITNISGNSVKNYAGKKTLLTTPKARIAFIEFNTRLKQLQNKNLRSAISNVINRQELTKNVLQDGSFAATSLIPKGDQTDPANGKDLTTETGSLLDYNVNTAKKDLAQAKQELGTNKISLTLMTDDTDTDSIVGQYIQSQVKKYLPGVTLSLKKLPHEQRVAQASAGKFQLDLAGWSPSWRDAQDFLQLGDKTSAANNTKWNSSEYVSLMKKVNDTKQYTTQQRYELMKQADELLMKSATVVPVYQAATNNLVSTKLQGVHVNPLDGSIQYQFASWK